MFTSRATGDGDTKRLRTSAMAQPRQVSPPSDIHSPLVSHQEVPVSRILRNSRSTSSLLKDNAECVGGMRTLGVARMASNEGRSGTEAEPAYGALEPCSPTQSFALGMLVSYQPIEDTPAQLHPDLRDSRRRSSRFGQESRDDACTPTVHAQITYEFCHGPITSPPSSEQVSMRRNLWYLGKLLVAEVELSRDSASSYMWPQPNPPLTKEHLQNPSNSPIPWADNVRIRTLFSQTVPLSPIPNPHRRSCHCQAGTAGDGAHTDEPWVALGIHTQDLRFAVAPPAWVP
ncbi:hypothetical protein BKA70DRAFT_1488900 [Coprinopsis sp. MPI-PUGE-AT-0042]|nr:hypothetical protein BKA70DRAFT_1488900 [Coprinopsis sp. MPI-PUGE-AT-0042]